MKKFIFWFVAVFLVITSTTDISAQYYSEDISWLIDVLELKEGSVVADIGAGDGEETLALARHIGSAGEVYCTELGADSVQYLRNVIDSEPVSNVTVIAGAPSKTNLPEQCCDGIFMRRVYHHFEDPAAMNKSLWRSLKPGGRLAVIDFAPRGSESADADGRSLGSQHGVTAETVIKELREAGFTLISSKKSCGRDVYVVMQKPKQ